MSACREPEVEGDDESAVEQGLGFGQAGSSYLQVYTLMGLEQYRS